MEPAAKRSMGLKGNLEDLPLLDILQIVAYSKKTGYLKIETGFGSGAVVFKDGLVVCAYSWSTLSYLRQIAAGDYGTLKETIVQDQIEISLRDLARLREGAFQFKLTAAVATSLDGVDVSGFLLFEGINPHHLLLDLARELDEDRRDTTELLHATLAEAPTLMEPVPPAALAHEAPEPADQKGATSTADEVEPAVGTETTIVLVDDEPQVAEVVGNELRSRGYRVLTADGPLAGAELVSRVAGSGEPVAVVVDLCMPTSSGRSFHGGFELVRTLKKQKLSAPILLMAERLSETARARAKDLGIRRVALKPALSKLDPEQYMRDLRSFAALLEKPLRKMLKPDARPGDLVPHGLSEEGPRLLDFLTTMTAKLMDPDRQADISGLVLQVASRYAERGILFLVRNDQVAGLAGFGLDTSPSASVGRAQQLVIDLEDVPLFAEVVRSRRTRSFKAPLVELAPLYARVDPGLANESLVVPMLNNGEVLALLYCDNASTGKPLGKLRGLELFVAQASMALENVFLHRKLRQHKEKPASVPSPY